MWYEKSVLPTKVDYCTSSVHFQETKDDIATGDDGIVKKKVDREDVKIKVMNIV